MVLGSVRMMISLKPMEWGDYLVFIKKKKKEDILIILLDQAGTWQKALNITPCHWFVVIMY